MANDSGRPTAGTLAWQDLTVENAEAVRDFYQAVIGWESSGVSMGEYEDFNMLPQGSNGDESKAVAGICHARGCNADLPPQWLLYFMVDNVDESAKKCETAGGALVVRPRNMGGGRFCVIRDPAGAVCALWQAP